MTRELALKIALIAVGLLFSAAVYPMIWLIRREPALAMMMSVYSTFGVFLLIASRNPAAHRSLISFAAWSSLAHASLMAFQAFRGMIARSELIGVAVFAVVGIVLLALTPEKSSAQSAPAAAIAHS